MKNNLSITANIERVECHSQQQVFILYGVYEEVAQPFEWQIAWDVVRTADLSPLLSVHADQVWRGLSPPVLLSQEMLELLRAQLPPETIH